jgi:hypothetical protein
MIRIALLIALAACSPSSAVSPSPRSCGNPCSTSSQCSDFFSGCRVCFLGKCAASLPATPIADAGIDAAPDAK